MASAVTVEKKNDWPQWGGVLQGIRGASGASIGEEDPLTSAVLAYHWRSGASGIISMGVPGDKTNLWPQQCGRTTKEETHLSSAALAF
mmetsp:Transcript_37859/g.113173  ORF Transcript_37859/g.113173 Transcript_37859/m.113173 type:complete len:88 (-) Transcript_37859:265-528(-)